MIRSKKIILGFFGILLFVPLLLHFGTSLSGNKIRCQAMIVPERVWQVVRNNDGGLIAALQDNRSGLVENYVAFQIERGDVFSFELSGPGRRFSLVQAGDTLAHIQSQQLAIRKTELEREIVRLKWQFLVDSSGAKPELITRAQAEAKRAEENFRMQKQIATRLDSLFHRGLVSQEEYQLGLNRLRTAELEWAAARAELASLKSGAKAEQLQALKMELTAAQKELASLVRKEQQLILKAPFSGTLSAFPNSDSLLVLSSLERMAILLLPEKYSGILQPGLQVLIRDDKSRKFKGSVVRWEQRVRRVANQPYLLVSAQFRNGLRTLPSGRIRSAWLVAERRNWLDSASSLLSFFFQ